MVHVNVYNNNSAVNKICLNKQQTIKKLSHLMLTYVFISIKFVRLALDLGI